MARPRWWSLEQRLLRVRRSLAHAIRGPRTVYVSARRGEYRGYWEAAAAALGAELVELTPAVWEIRRGDRRTLISSYVTQCDNPVLLRLAGDKGYTLRLAARVGLPVPEHVVVTATDLAPARALLERLGGWVVVKPLKGSASGLGVTTHVRDARGLRRAALLASLYHEEILVEELIAAESCRFLYLAGELLAAVRRRGVRVIGDGTSTIASLLRGAGVADPAADRVVAATLARQRLALDAVPESGAEVLGRNVPVRETEFEELRTVYDEDITDRVAPALAAEVGQVVRALGSEFAGVDVMTSDPGLTLAASGGTFLEINTTPGLHHHYVSVTDPSRGPAVSVLAYLLEKHGTSAPAVPAGSDPSSGRPGL